MSDSLYETKPDCKFLDSIVRDASRNMKLIGPWRNASIEHPILKEYIEQIKERHVEYCDALDMSIRPARDACDISGDAIILCGYLRDETRSREHIQSFILDMKAKARSSHRECKQIMEMLGSINQGLIKVTHQFAKEAQRKPQLYNGKTLFVTLLSDKCEKKDIEFKSAMQALSGASNSLENLTKSTNHFSEWWGTVRRELSNVQKDMGTIRDSEQRIGTMEKHWRLLNENFKRYMDQIVWCRQLFPLDLDEAVTDLKANVENAMVSLYNLQTYIINRNGTNTTASEVDFTELRKDLRAQWENLRIYLQRCHAFGADVFMLKEAFGTETTQDLTEFLGEMAASAEELQGHSKDLLENYASMEIPRIDALRMSASSNGYRSSAARIRPEVRDADLQAFIDTSLAAAAPDGDKALSEFKRALARIYSNLVTLYQFWTNVSVKCRSYLSANITTKQAENITADWTCYQEAIEAAIVSITKTSDAVTVEAVGAYNADISHPALILTSAVISNDPVCPSNSDHPDQSRVPTDVGASVDPPNSDCVDSSKLLNVAKGSDTKKNPGRIRGVLGLKNGRRFGLGKPITWVKRLRKKTAPTSQMENAVDIVGIEHPILAPSPPAASVYPVEASDITSHAPSGMEETSGSPNVKESKPAERMGREEQQQQELSRESRRSASENHGGVNGEANNRGRDSPNHKGPGRLRKFIDQGRNKFKKESEVSKWPRGKQG